MSTVTPITVTLNSLDELFAEPSANPWDPAARYRSGIDEIFSKLRAIPVYEDVELVLRLPRSEVEAGLEQRARDAIGRYCAARIEANAEEIDGIRKEGRRDFFISIGVVAGLMAVILVLGTLVGSNDVIQAALVAWTGIAAWAILWNPVDTYVWGWRPSKRDIKYCEKVSAAPLRIESA